MRCGFAGSQTAYDRAYRRLFGPLVRNADPLFRELLGPLRPPRHPLAMARFGLSGIRSAHGLARSRFADDRARALLAGFQVHMPKPVEPMELVQALASLTGRSPAN